jgi:precorrin-3B C17-methyltransferase
VLPLPSQGKGKLYIVGIGPGALEHLTIKAEKVLNSSDYIIGNKIYLELIEDLIKGKKIVESTMGEEINRAKIALDLSKDNIVSLISGGDPNVYGMAGIVFEVAEKAGMNEEIEIEVVPGITSAIATSSFLGAPLSNDFAVISLSDLLTPWERIEENLAHVSSSNFVIVLYNPRSRGRNENFRKAIGIIKRYRNGETPVGIVKNYARENEEKIVSRLKDVLEYEEKVDMHTTVIIGNEESRIWKEKIITPRGYHRKYEL